MLNEIKSSYFIQKFFSYIDEKQKLKVIKYNKSLQVKVDINIANYKHFSGKYVIYENGIGKEYSFTDNKLKYEGEFLHGMRNGKGKEYKEDRVIFEGEYLNGKRNGNGKEYIYIGFLQKLDFEGSYLNGLRSGEGKEYQFTKYNEDGDDGLAFEGSYLNGLRQGKGKEYFSITGSLIFEGEYSKGKRNGKGKEYNINDEDELVFEGNYLNDKRHGEGKEYCNEKIVFEGKYCYGYKSKGKFYVNDKIEYEGEYLYGRKWNGKGYDENGNVIYELINGNGKVKEYEYEYEHGQIDELKLVYEGEYVNGRKKIEN